MSLRDASDIAMKAPTPSQTFYAQVSPHATASAWTALK
jgi:hypothetical protein